MEKPTYRRTYIKEWRDKRGLSLRRLAERLEEAPGGDLLLSHTSIGRIEKGQQPYSQPILEALAAALGVPAWMLLEVNPEKDGDVIDNHSPTEQGTARAARAGNQRNQCPSAVCLRPQVS